MTFTPSTKGAFFAGVGLWLLLWLSLFKLDEIFADTHLRYFVSSERSIAWINRHRSATLLGTELVNYGTHGISQPDSVVFAIGGTIVNLLMILVILPIRSLRKARI
jgi:hypothetical protein